MSALVETLFYAGREKPWHGLGTNVEECPTSKEAIHLAGLDWRVISQPIFAVTAEEIPNYKANVRDFDSSVLGIVSNKYKIVQNDEAFDFVDNLVDGKSTRYETAGSLKKGRTIWLLAKMPSVRVLGDEVEPYLCFTNTHDGTGAIKACCTPVRVVCNNTLNFALQTASRCWSVKHMGDLSEKLFAAEETLGLAHTYMSKLSEEADKLANTKLERDKIDDILKELFPLNEEDSSEIVKKRVQGAKDNILVCYSMPDLKQFQGTAYGFMNAIADFVAHSAPMRMTKNYQENNFERIVYGHPILDKAFELMNAKIMK